MFSSEGFSTFLVGRFTFLLLETKGNDLGSSGLDDPTVCLPLAGFLDLKLFSSSLITSFELLSGVETTLLDLDAWLLLVNGTNPLSLLEDEVSVVVSVSANGCEALEDGKEVRAGTDAGTIGVATG